jgi:hypothetical protein
MRLDWTISKLKSASGASQIDGRMSEGVLANRRRRDVYSYNQRVCIYIQEQVFRSDD